MRRTCLVHLASGVGNIVLATPLLVTLDELGFDVDVCLDADYAQTAALLQPWSVVRMVHVTGVESSLSRRAYEIVVPAIPPFYWGRFARTYAVLDRRRSRRTLAVPRPPDALFARDEQAYYLAFARALGATPDRGPFPTLPIGPVSEGAQLTAETVVLAPGCKTGIMAAKRWPHFGALAERYADVAVVGTSDDLRQHDGSPMRFPGHVQSFVDRLTLRQTAEMMAGAPVVIANDSGLAHVAAAVGTPTVMLFGPTDHLCLGAMAPNVTVLRAGLPCEPCWTTNRLAACGGRVECLRVLTVDAVAQVIDRCLGRATDACSRAAR